MKLLVVTALPPLKSPEADHAFRLCEQLADHGVDVHVIAQRGSVAATHPRMTVYPIMRNWSWWDWPRLARSMRRCAPDAVLLMFVYWVYDHPMITFLPTLSKRLFPGVPFVTLFEDADPMKDFPFLSKIIRKVMKHWAGAANVNYGLGTLLRDSDRFIVVSDRIRAALAKHRPDLDGQTMLIPPPPLLRLCPDGTGIVRRRKRESLGVAPEDVLLIFFGYVYRGKGLETLFRSLRAVSQQRKNVHLLIAGGSIPGTLSYAEELRGLASQLGVADRVTWTGGYEWDSEEPSHYLQAADICVLPFDRGVSIHNSSFAAAAAHRLPTITTRGPTLEEAFVHNENVYLCPPRDEEALAAAIEHLVDEPKLRDQLSQGVFNLAEEWFSWEQATERTLVAISGADLSQPTRVGQGAGC
jgi:glycosyltransferase involved in cell wall biosynthesis